MASELKINKLIPFWNTEKQNNHEQEEMKTGKYQTAAVFVKGLRILFSENEIIKKQQQREHGNHVEEDTGILNTEVEPIDRTKNRMQNSHRAGESMRTEKYPGETNQIESNKSIHRFFPKWHSGFVNFHIEHFLPGEINSI